MRTNLGALTMVPAGTRRILLSPLIQKLAPSVAQAVAAMPVTRPVTPPLPMFAPGLMSMMESRAGAGQMTAPTYEEKDAGYAAGPSGSSAPFMYGGRTQSETEKKPAALLPLAALAAYFLLG